MAGSFPSALHASRRRSIVAALHARRRNPLAACVASIFVLAAPTAAIAASWTVNSCDGELVSGDIPTKTGTLRFAVANAASGDTVDLSGRTGPNACANSKISLTTGSLSVTQSSLELLGPAGGITIDASGIPCAAIDQDCYGRTIAHGGVGGQLYLKHVNVSGGYYKTYNINSVGGCIFSKGDVKLKYATASACKVYTVNGHGLGGGIYALGKVTLNESTVSGNGARGGSSTKGGGIYAKGDTELDFSYTTGNTATSTASQARGGGIYTLGNLTISIGSVSNNAASSTGTSYGGGALAIGNVTADGALISGNSVISTGNKANGGGLFAPNPVNLQQSMVTGNKANGNTGSQGAGVQANNGASISYTTVSDNTAYGSGRAGGLLLTGNVNSITTSTISGNHAEFYGGVDAFSEGALASSFLMANSTISGNVATGPVGGIYVDSATTKFYNSTIAFNTAGTGSAPGVLLSAKNGSMQMTLQSTLMSNNTVGAADNDLSTFTGLGTVIFNGGLTGQLANNLIFKTSVTGLPNDTKKGQCPNLGTLRDNGGPTYTHALMSKSPAIDNGNYVFGGLTSFDQRGQASVNGQIDYVRVSGLTAKADIGAYEVQQDEIVFNANFEGCPAP
jgi:hypothetical protein